VSRTRLGRSPSSSSPNAWGFTRLFPVWVVFETFLTNFRERRF
jgi:hypothetical protein